MRNADDLAAALFGQQGFLIIQSRTTRTIGELLYPATRAYWMPGESLVMKVVGEATKEEFLQQHSTVCAGTVNILEPAWNYFYRVEAAD